MRIENFFESISLYNRLELIKLTLVLNLAIFEDLLIQTPLGIKQSMKYVGMTIAL